MTIEPSLNDEAILTELGRRMASQRIALSMTQAELAEQAGIGKRTLERMEAGGSSQLASLVRVLRVLGLVQGLESLLPAPGPRPMETLRRRDKNKERRRVRRAKVTDEAPARPWTWGDEE